MASSRDKAMFIKLDMSKAYDRVNQGFLLKILGAFGFSSEWINWVMCCVKTPSFSVLINGESSELFGASRGLRQGDPLSPYLFILMAEGLGRLIKSQVAVGLIHGWNQNNSLSPQFHLQFVDDSALMGDAKVAKAVAFHQTLDCYLAASGQRINESKSCIYFFNTPRLIQQRIARILRFQVGKLPFTYLGIPLDVRPPPRHFWQELIDKF